MPLISLTSLILYDNTHAFAGGIEVKDVMHDVTAHLPLKCDLHLVIFDPMVDITVSALYMCKHLCTPLLQCWQCVSWIMEFWIVQIFAVLQNRTRFADGWNHKFLGYCAYVKNVNDMFNVRNHRWSQFRPTGPAFASLSTDEASVVKYLA